MFKKTILLALVVVFTVSLNSCRCQGPGERIAERIAEKAIEKQTGKKVDVDLNKGKGQITIQGDSGKITIGGGDITGLPPELVYPNAVTQGSASSETATEKGYTVTFKTKDDLAKIESHYTSTLKASGWTQKGRFESKQEDEAVVTFSFEKEKKNLALSLHRETDETESDITLIYSEKKQ